MLRGLTTREVLVRGNPGRKARPSFLKKRSKRLLFRLSRTVQQTGTQETKVFWFFFSKKNCLPCLLT